VRGDSCNITSSLVVGSRRASMIDGVVLPVESQ
jgi:hypothetical protein